ncbi:MAG TPA: helix-turn-helix transcriptional regulator [Longimicrobiales bacterium]|nr:helix-turn-helix transcriptional regulator [Longimicrobiales bacterium]
MPTVTRDLPLGAAAWSSIRQFAGAEGTHRVTRSGVLRTPAGTRIYVVVVEPASEAFPPPAALRLRYLLTHREAEVALLLARRLSGPEIAMRLGISIHTTRRHTEQVLSKLGVTSRLDVRPALERLARAEDAAEPDSPGDRGTAADWQAPAAVRLRVEPPAAGRLAG